MKSNPYVYPYVPFQDLGNKDIRNTFEQKKNVSWNDISAELENIISINKNIAEGESTAEKIFNIFISEEILFGPKDFLIDNKEHWINQFNSFISENKKLTFTIFGFPFKIPVALKTNRTMPDMGEVLSLAALYKITQLVGSVYVPGCTVTVFAEDGFDKFVGVSKEESQEYVSQLQRYVKELGWSESIIITHMSAMEDQPKYDEVFKEKVAANIAAFESQGEDYMKAFEGAYPSLYRIVRPDTDDAHVLMDVYNDNLEDNQLSDQALQVRQQLKSDAQNAVHKYFAYLKTRDALEYIEKVVPNFIPLSVSPKPNRLGIIPVNKHCTRIPYHGVPVKNTDGVFTIEYLVDIQRDESEYQAIYLDGDVENVPFWYEQI